MHLTRRRFGGAVLAAPSLAGGALALLRPREARAASLEVSPVSTEMAPGQMAAVITVVNRDAAPTAVQVRAFDWSQEARQDRLTPTQDLVVSPPSFQLPPGGTQVVRLVLRRPAPVPERAFRLLMDELPVPGQDRQQVRFALRLSLPVFVQAAPPGRAQLDWRVGPDGELAVTNRGTRRAQLAGLTVTAPGGARLAMIEPENPYVLPGTERRWRFRDAPPRAGTTLKASGTSEGNPFAVDIQVAAR